MGVIELDGCGHKYNIKYIAQRMNFNGLGLAPTLDAEMHICSSCGHIQHTTSSASPSLRIHGMLFTALENKRRAYMKGPKAHVKPILIEFIFNDGWD